MATHSSPSPVECPFPDCAYRGRHLPEHIRDAHGDAAIFVPDVHATVISFHQETTVRMHRSTAYRVLAHPPSESVILLVNNGLCEQDTRLRWLELLCIGHADRDDREYTMQVRGSGSGEDDVHRASGRLPCVRRWPGPVPLDADRVRMLVPDSCWSFFGTVSVTVRQGASIAPPPPVIVLDSP